MPLGYFHFIYLLTSLPPVFLDLWMGLKIGGWELIRKGDGTSRAVKGYSALLRSMAQRRCLPHVTRVRLLGCVCLKRKGVGQQNGRIGSKGLPMLSMNKSPTKIQVYLPLSWLVRRLPCPSVLPRPILNVEVGILRSSCT
ncbi:hypothetical protein GGR54DRAFT_557683 [Hypoxylon sp. NC1633]|nr:hypothetical protein GGR54DRAFT_557683 [Hypoxylon sp. NC1633]